MKIIITGMHRSGISMIAGILQICGVFFGINQPSVSDSSKEFQAINREILEINGGDWLNIPEHIGMVNTIRFKIIDFINRQLDNKLIGFADPCACLTIKLWHDILKDLEKPFKVVFISRNIEEIIQSLYNYNKIDRKFGRELTLKYINRFMENTTRFYSNIIKTNFEDYFDFQYNSIKLENEIKKLCGFLGLENNKICEIEDFINPELYHHKGDSKWHSTGLIV